MWLNFCVRRIKRKFVIWSLIFWVSGIRFLRVGFCFRIIMAFLAWTLLI